jgi:hypothetical protein
MGHSNWIFKGRNSVKDGSHARNSLVPNGAGSLKNGFPPVLDMDPNEIHGDPFSPKRAIHGARCEKAGRSTIKAPDTVITHFLSSNTNYILENRMQIDFVEPN